MQQKIARDGYIYVFQKNLANDIRSFECELRRKGSCKARIKVDLGDRVVGEVNEHTHPASGTKVEVCKLKSNKKESAENTGLPPQNILGNELVHASATAVANLPRLENMRRTIRHQRQDHDQPINPLSREAIPDNISLLYQQTENRQRFLLFDSGSVDGQNRILIFASDNGLQLLRDSEDWFCDGTFKVCPEIFFQFYTVHARSNGRVIPCVFGLLPNKTRDTYARFFTELTNHVHQPDDPSTILFDFELAAINAATDSFPTAEITCCFFHLCTNMRKKIQAVGLQDRYLNEPELSLHLRMVLALAFVPPVDVVESFERLHDLLREAYGDNLDEVLEYFENTYIGRFRRNAPRANPIFSIAMWNMFHRTHQEMPRTNNNIEGWHRRFQGLCMGHHLTFWKFLSTLKKEESVNRAEMAQIEAGHAPPAQRRRYMDVNERILNLVDNYGNRELFPFLRGIAHNIGH